MYLSAWISNVEEGLCPSEILNINHFHKVGLLGYIIRICLQDITHVVNFDFPRNIEDYVHRVGRAGRAGKTGTSITFVERRDRKSAEELIRILQEAGQEVPYELQKMADKYEIYKQREAEAKKAFGGRNFGGGGRR